MATVKRKVRFYKLMIERETYVYEDEKILKKSFSLDDIKKYFHNIYVNEMKILKEGNHAIEIKETSKDYSFEVVKYDDTKVVIKIGHETPKNTMDLRDKQTLETEDVPLKNNQRIELYTYCQINFDTGIVSYICISSAPRISALKLLFSKYISENERIKASFPSIISKDIVQKLSNKNLIGRVELSIVVPSDEVLKDFIPDNMHAFDSLNNVKTRTVTYSIVADRNKNIFDETSFFEPFITTIKSKYENNLKSLKVGAKNYKENMETYDLLNTEFTRTVNFDFKNIDEEKQEEYLYRLDKTYNDNIDELLKYIRL